MPPEEHIFRLDGDPEIDEDEKQLALKQLREAQDGI